MAFLIAEAILCLQEQLAGDEWFGVVGSDAVVLVGIGRGAVAIGETCGVAVLVIANVAQTVAFAFAVGIAAIGSDAEIASDGVKPSIEDEVGTDAVVVPFRTAARLVVVHFLAGIHQVHLTERVVHSVVLVGVGIECGVFSCSVAVVATK